MEETDLDRQLEEVEALKSIYDNVSSRRKYSGELIVEIRINEPEMEEVVLKVENPTDYPSKSVPYYEISAPFLRGKSRSDLCGKLEEISEKNPGEMLLYLWIESIREYILNLTPTNKKRDTPSPELNKSSTKRDEPPLPEIITSPTIIQDRKSIFQAHYAKVSSVTDVRRVINKLLENKKIAHATHNMYAYRINCSRKKCLVSDCDDDGENNAGSRILHLLDITGVENVLVIVSRWYGGVQLGPDRFKHINNAARIVLEENGLLHKNSSSNNNKRSKK
ncbi:protein IMPACT-B [Lepeophtheirus salmonis]|uniref:Putative LOC767623 [Bombyx mori] n=1 Tax=Lepeophtheirus salmonis TaxID=72036 RepID=A0A0K2TUG2_LEPSM|nr:protein IMPACT-B-like [Lepeophtheirus salmonis]XP_040576342.1 protein IMPACT-B-like [Lepeophtheirus salmonis]